MRIVHVIPTLGPLAGGANLSCRQLCEHLAALGNEVTIVATDRDPPEDWPSCRNRIVGRGVLRIELVSVWWITSHYFVSWRMVRLLRKLIREADIVHIHSLYRFHLAAAALLCQIYRVPYIVKPHGSLDPYLYRHRRIVKALHERLVERRALSRASAVHFTAHEEKELALSTGLWGHSGLRSAAVVPNGIVIAEGFAAPLTNDTDANEFLNAFPALAGKRIILFLGRLHFKKGLDLLVPAFSQIHRRYVDSHLVIVGPDAEGYGKRVRDLVERERLTSCTSFVGMLSGPKKWAAFQAAQVFVLPSYTENFGIAIIEAMSMGCPVVISNKVNIWREISEASAGLITECTVPGVRDAICSLLGDESLRQDLAVRAKRLVRERYDWSKVVLAMLEVYERLITEKA